MPHGMSVGRHVDREFQKLEYDELWSRVGLAVVAQCAPSASFAHSRLPVVRAPTPADTRV